MKNFIVGLCWWLVPAAIFIGHVYDSEWLFNIGIVACVILMLFASFAACLLLLPVFVPKTRPSTKELDDIKRKWTSLKKGYALFKLIVMVFMLAGAGWVATSVCYFLVTIFTWTVLYLLFASEKKNTFEVAK